MAEKTLPYVTAYGTIPKVLKKIQEASTTDRFTQDYLATKLDMPGGSAKPIIPFLKRTGFLASDGVPTDLYKRFRNEGQRGAAAAEALRTGYKPLYEINEYVHVAKDADLKGLVVQVTGAEPDSALVRSVIGSFNALKAVADFDADGAEDPDAAPEGDAANGGGAAGAVGGDVGGIKLAYTINLHLPATSDVAVFNAIFKSLREHLL